MIFLLLLVGGLSFGPLLFPSIHLQSPSEVNEPKSSAGEITIITPEEKIYTEPDSGYYYGTHGFECDKDGEVPLEFEVTTPDSASFIEVDEELAGHKKVCELRKAGGTITALLKTEFVENVTSGTIELWMYKDTDSSTDLNQIYLQQTGIGNVAILGIVNGDVYQHTYGSRTYIAYDVFTKNVWHHVRIDFDVSVGWQFALDGVWYGLDYSFAIENPAVTEISNSHIITGWSGVNPNYGTWIDAFGYSWHPDYDIGDNLKEGLLLSYDNTTNLDWQGYSLDGQDNVTILGNHTIRVPTNGTHSIQVFGNDTMGTIYQSDIRSFAINYWEEQPFSLNIIYPSQNEVFGQTSPDFLISGTEINASWYSLDYGVTNFTFTGFSGKIDQTEWEGKSPGTIPIRFYANNSVGELIFKDVLVVKDLITPIVNINEPTENLLFGSDPPNYDISITESNLEAYWYTLDDGTTNITISSLTGTVDQSEWDKRGSGTVDIKFFAVDEGSNEGFAEVTVRKDINIPLITINSPEALDIYGKSAPEFDLSVVEPNLDSMWYTLDGGSTLYPFVSFKGQIDATEWAKYGHGAVLIQFHAEDKVGNQAFAEVQVNKDLVSPVITINAPEFGNVFLDFSPLYDISIVETNLDSYWYSLDGGLTNITISTLSGAISESEWDSLSNGHITLTFYAEDEAGNIGEASVLITKNASETSPPGIPGYDVYILLGVFGILSFILIKKRFKQR